MRVVIAPDKFKGSLTAPEAAAAMARGVRRVDPRAVIDAIPMADGGEGRSPRWWPRRRGSHRAGRGHRPAGEPGDRVVRPARRRPHGGAGDGLGLGTRRWFRPTGATPGGARRGARASCCWPRSSAGARRVILGIGGSATNDGGAGLGQALGFRLLDSEGRELGPGGGELGRLARIDASGRAAALDSVEIAVACDVTNPLCGPTGASAVYGPQKGADAAMVEALDRNLAHFADIVERDLHVAIRDIPGSGAAGGLGGGLVAFAGGRLQRGSRSRHRGGELAEPPPGSRPLPHRRRRARRPERLRQDGRGRGPAGAVPWAVPPWPSPARSARARRPSWTRESTPTSASAPGPSPWNRPSRGRPSCSRTPRPRRCGRSSPGTAQPDAI